MALERGEPLAGPWHVEPLAQLVRALVADVNVHSRPKVLAIDGRSSNGKTTLAARIENLIPRSVVIHTDDIAWSHSRFGWTDLIIDGVLIPARSGQPVRYRPPAWDTHDRPGFIEVPAGTELLVIEGVGAGRRELVHLVDALIWIQSDLRVTEQRNVDRVGLPGGSPDVAAHQAWMAEEIPFVAEQRPWERADIIASGTPRQDHDSRTEIVVTSRRN